MKITSLYLICLSFFCASFIEGIDNIALAQSEIKTLLEDEFIENKKQLKPYYAPKKPIVMIASPGRSGSTLLTDVVKQYATHYTVLKTHLLPPNRKFKGKILFIFSNPDKAAESVLHRLLLSKTGGNTHFVHVESADQKWFDQIGRDARHQTEEHNLLAYDALGCNIQLEEWLHNRVQPCRESEAQILAIKYEHLWDHETVQAIKEFLDLQTFQLPPKEERGCTDNDLRHQEVLFKKIYNLGTERDPRYQAYDDARELWKQAAALQYLKLAN